MHHAIRTGILLLALLGTSIAAWAVKKPEVAGVYTIQGAKGAIVLTLRDEPENKVSGSLNGGDLRSNLKASAEGDTGGVLGVMNDANGQFMSYFRAYREGNQMIFEMIEAGPGGDPDFTKKNRIPFPLGDATPATPATPNTPATPPTQSAVSTDFVGIFKDETLIVDSKNVPGQAGIYNGTIKMGAQTFKFNAQLDEGALRGEFESPDGKFPFEARLNGRAMTFSTGGTNYQLTKQGGNPLAKPNNPLAKPNAPANPLTKPATPAANPISNTPNLAPKTANATLPGKSADNNAWKIYKHATGLSVRYPPNWKLQETNGVGILSPPDVISNAQGPTEVYLILANGAEGIQDVNDARVAAQAEGALLQLAPFLQRVGQPQNMMAGTNPGLLLSWEGTNPLGLNVRANIMMTILKGYGIALVALGDKNKIAARDGILKDIFASLAAGAGERDANLVGRWSFWSYKSSADGKFGTETKRRFQFLADGTCYWQSSGESSGNFQGRDSLGNQTFVGGVAGQSTNGDKGQWTAGNGKLYVLWDDGTTGTWDYEVRQNNGKKLLLKGNQNQPDEWMAE